MGFRARRGGGYGDERGAAVYELGFLQLGSGGPVYVWVVVSGQRIWKLLAAVRRGARVVAIRERKLVYGFVVWLGVCGFAAVGLAAVSLWRLGIRAGVWMAVVAGTWIWRFQWICAVPAGDGGVHPLEDGIAGSGAGASAGC